MEQLQFEKHYCPLIDRELVVLSKGRINIPCEYYHAARNRYSGRINRVCSFYYPETNQVCEVEKQLRKNKISKEANRQKA